MRHRKGDRGHTYWLRLLATTDLHGHARPHDYARDAEVPGIGLAGLTPLIARARAEAPATLLFDVGDFLQGTPLSERPMTTGAGPSPMVEAMNLLGYDAVALGNHDFDFGLAGLDAALAGARFPVLCSNLRRGDGTGGQPWAASHILDVALDGAARLRVGVVAAVPPQTVDWNRAALKDAVAAADIVEGAASEAAALREDGADLVIALCHSGPGAPTPDLGAEDAALGLAATGACDAVFLGHSHRCLPGPDYAALPGVDAAEGRLAGVPAAMAGERGSHLAVIDLALAPRPSGGWEVLDAKVALRTQPEAAGPPDARVLAATEAAHASTLQELARPVGRSDQRLHALLPFVGVAPALRLMAEAQAAAARAQVAGTTLATLPLLSAVAPFRIGAAAGVEIYPDIPPGPITDADLRALTPFANHVSVVAASGAELRRWLAQALAVFRTLTPGMAAVPLLQDDALPYAFDVFAGLDYTIDLTKPPGPDRIAALNHAGRAITDTDQFAVATSSYRAAGGAGYAPVLADLPGITGDRTLRAALAERIASDSAIRVDEAPFFRIAPSGAAAMLPPVHGVDADLAAAAGLRIDPAYGADWDPAQLRLRV